MLLMTILCAPTISAVLIEGIVGGTVHGRFDTSRFGTKRSQFVIHVKSIRYKLTLLQAVSRQNTMLERTQTSVENKTSNAMRTHKQFG